MYAGSDDSVKIVSKYWGGDGANFWLRTPFIDVMYVWDGSVLYATTFEGANSWVMAQNISDKDIYTKPAFDLNLSSVLFSSAAVATTSTTVVSGNLANDASMKLRLNGSSQSIGSVLYYDSTGRIVAKKDTDATGTVALVVQGKEGTKDWYYSKPVTGTTVATASEIKKALNLSANVSLEKCKIWMERTISGMSYATMATAGTPTQIGSVSVAGITAPVGGQTFDTVGTASATGLKTASKTPAVTWTKSGSNVTGKAAYNTTYRATVKLESDLRYAFASNVKVTFNGKSVTAKDNSDGTITVSYDFTTAKAKLQKITAPKAITGINNGAAKTAAALGLPKTVTITTEDTNVKTANVTWNLDKLASGTYDPEVLTQQTFTVNGTVAVPSGIDSNKVSLTTQATVTVNAAGIVGAPTASLAEGTYDEEQEVELSSGTAGAVIYYTRDGSTPSTTNGIRYSGAIKIFGTEGKAVTTTLKAIAVKDGMQESDVSEFEYVINIPDTTPPTITIRMGLNRWQSLWSPGDAVYFARDIAEVGISVIDNLKTNPTTIDYYLSDEELTEEQLRGSGIAWNPFMGILGIGSANREIVYVRAMDEAGNMAFANTARIVVFEDSVQDTAELTYIKNVSGEQYANVILNGNTIAEISDGSRTLTPGTDYVIGEDGAITFEESYLASLTPGDNAYTLTIRYNPRGEIYGDTADGSKPDVTTIALYVRNPKLLEITTPMAVTGVANGTPKDTVSLGLPSTVTINTEDTDVTTADVVWNLDELVNGSYDPAVLTEQSFTIKGTVALPEGIDANGNSLEVMLDVTVSVAGIVGTPIATPAAGIYASDQEVTLATSTPDAQIYYTTDGSEPSAAGTCYTEAIPVTGTEGGNVVTVIRAIAVKDGMQDSAIADFTYAIQLPAPKYTATITDGTGSGDYEAGATVTIVANQAPEGKRFKNWTVESGSVELADHTSATTTFTMPAETVGIRAEYEEIPVTTYTITASAGDNGSITPSGAVTVEEGGRQTFAITADDGYEIQELLVDDEKITVQKSYTFVDVNSDHTIEVTFKKQTVVPGDTETEETEDTETEDTETEETEKSEDTEQTEKQGSTDTTNLESNVSIQGNISATDTAVQSDDLTDKTAVSSRKTAKNKKEAVQSDNSADAGETDSTEEVCQWLTQNM